MSPATVFCLLLVCALAKPSVPKPDEATTIKQDWKNLVNKITLDKDFAVHVSKNPRTHHYFENVGTAETSRSYLHLQGAWDYHYFSRYVSTVCVCESQLLTNIAYLNMTHRTGSHITSDDHLSKASVPLHSYVWSIIPELRRHCDTVQSTFIKFESILKLSTKFHLTTVPGPDASIHSLPTDGSRPSRQNRNSNNTSPSRPKRGLEFLHPINLFDPLYWVFPSPRPTPATTTTPAPTTLSPSEPANTLLFPKVLAKIWTRLRLQCKRR